MAQVVGTTVWYADHAAAEVNPFLTPASARRADGSCEVETSSVTNAVPAYTFTLPTFTPPFHLEAEDCRLATVAALGPRTLLTMCALLAFVAVVWLRRPTSA